MDERKRLLLWTLSPWLLSVPLLAVDVHAWGLGAWELGIIGLVSQEPEALVLMGVLVTIVVPPTLVVLFAKLLRNVSHLLGFGRLDRARSVRWSAVAVLLFVSIPLAHDLAVVLGG